MYTGHLLRVVPSHAETQYIDTCCRHFVLLFLAGKRVRVRLWRGSWNWIPPQNSRHRAQDRTRSEVLEDSTDQYLCIPSCANCLKHASTCVWFRWPSLQKQFWAALWQTGLLHSSRRCICTSGSRGPWRPGPPCPQHFFFQNHAVFRHFKGKKPYFEQILGSQSPWGQNFTAPPD